jgi:hypothetical protein
MAIDNFLNSAADYECHLIEWARNNPRFEIGMHVSLSNPGGTLVGTGVISKVEWKREWNEHLYTVELFGGEVFKNVGSCYLERHIWDTKNTLTVYKGGRK